MSPATEPLWFAIGALTSIEQDIRNGQSPIETRRAVQKLKRELQKSARSSDIKENHSLKRVITDAVRQFNEDERRANLKPWERDRDSDLH
jgi:hypothetical protein